MIISICDDDKEHISELKKIINRWAEKKSLMVEIKEYASAEKFIFSYIDNPCDLLLLDIQMNGINGMELAKKLRSEGNMLPIIFITGYSDYMNDGYEVEALHYLLKPLQEEKLFEVLDRYIKKNVNKPKILLKCEDNVFVVSQEEIVYCEAFGKKTQINFSDGKQLTYSEGISKLIEILDKNFIFCHRSYIVNLKYINSISKNSISLDNSREIPISRRLYKEVNEKFIEFYEKKFD